MPVLESPVWLGELPSHWNLVPAWCLYRRVKRTGHPTEELLSVYRDHGVVPKSSRDDNHNVESEDLSGYQLVKPGDLVMNKMKAWQGSIALSEYQGIVSPAYFVFQPLHHGHLKYFHYLLRSQQYIGAYNRISKGVRVGQWDLDPAYFRTLPIPVPPIEEQKAIAEFLDRELSRIDELIDRQEKLISIVLERLNGVLYESVCGTRFESTASGEVSGEWFHSLPKDWSVKRVSAITNIVNGHPFDSETFSGNQEDMPLVRIRDLIAESFETFVPRENTPRSSLIRDGDVLIGMDGDFNVKLWNRGEAALNQRVCLLRCKETTLAKYLAIALPFALKRINDLTYATTVKHLSSGQVAKIKVPIPPKDVLEIVCRDIEEKVTSAGLLVERAGALISLSKERRQALINSAVTGKINVRGKN